jgi:Chaperone of endosialidase
MSNSLHLMEMHELDEDAFKPRSGRYGRGQMRFYGKGGGGSAPTPDPAIGQAAQANVALGEHWLEFAKQQFADGNKRQETTDALNTKVINQQLATQDQASTWAQQDRKRTLDVFQPIENQFVDTAKNFDTPEKQEEAAATAKADVLSSAGTQQQSNQRQMAAMGVSPDSGRYAGITRSQDTNTALASAGAQNNARQVIRDKGLALKGDAVNMGKGLASSTAAAYGIGTNAGNSAVQNNQQGNNNFYQNGQVMQQGFSGAIGANNSAGSMLNSLYGNQLNAWSTQQQANATSSAGIGSLVGTIGAGVMTGGTGSIGGLLASKLAASDINIKQNIKRIGTLDNGVPVYAFEYKQEYKDAWGHGMRIGVMAQEIESIIPDAVSLHEDGYKVVDYEKVVNHGI